MSKRERTTDGFIYIIGKYKTGKNLQTLRLIILFSMLLLKLLVFGHQYNANSGDLKCFKNVYFMDLSFSMLINIHFQKETVKNF